MEEVQRANKMGTAKVLPLLVSMSIPAMFSMLIQSLYNVVDSIFVAQLDEFALTAVSLAFPVQQLMIAVGVGMAIGTGSLISRRLGEKRREEASLAAENGLFLAALSYLLFALLGLFGTETFIRAFASSEIVAEYSCTYTYIVTIGSFGLFLSSCLEKTLQATGNMIFPMLIQLTGAVTNIVLDPIMIFGLFGFPKLGVAGAALATILGQILGMVLAAILVHCREHEVNFELKKFRPRAGVIREIYAVGFPSIIMQAISSVMVSFLNLILIRFSEAAVSVLGAYFKLQSFVFMPVFGLTQGALPIIGYNYGAGSKKRMMQALRYATLIACGIMGVGELVFNLFPSQLLWMFNPSEEMLRLGIPALRTISLCFLPAAVGIVFSTFFQAVGSGGKSLMVSMLRQLVILMPAAYLLSRVGVNFVWYAFPIAEVFSLGASVLLLIRTKRRQVDTLRTTLAE